MKILRHAKDGGPESRVDAYFLIEWKGLFSIALLRFGDGSRESYHDHAFDAVSWLLSGRLVEQNLGASTVEHTPGLRPIRTWRSTFHRVLSIGTSWVLTFRGPWSKTWREFDPRDGHLTTLAQGRKVVS